ncbi:MAG: hypothetical protein NC418_07595 [Muribaculaceae bacterium]|nr:hypothetical protein [Muribaculaceae bacterium]
MDDYKDIKEVLKPRRDFRASDELRQRIASTLDSHTSKRRPRWWIWSTAGACAAALVLALIVPHAGVSAKEILEETMYSLLNSHGIEMTVNVRTRPMENFKYINVSDDFVEHNISIVKSESSTQWRVDKGGRTAAGNDTVVYSWIDGLNIGWKFDNAAAEEVLGELAVLLAPERIFEVELQNCINSGEAQYTVERSGDDILLTVRSEPHGDFFNPYMLNASIAESENVRRYEIDAHTGHLKSATVAIIDGGVETEVVKISKVIYDIPKTNPVKLPSRIRCLEMPRSIPRGLAGLSAAEAASAFLNALETWNEAILDAAIDENIKDGMYEQELKGAVLVSVGKSFTSGNEEITYVPYVLRLPGGVEKRHKLALRRNDQRGWIIVGGL